jgi:uncharacterized protein
MELHAMSSDWAGPVAFHVMVKPIGPICNLDCRYCFYLHKEDLLPEENRQSWRMSPETQEAYIRQYIEAQDVPEIEFAWQGGEPTLLGVDFFRRAVELQQKYCPPGKRIQNAFQTNGVLLDDEWGEFLRENDFLIGISIDGPQAIHDKYRVDKGGRPSWERVMAGREVLVKHGVRHNALVCVNRYNGDRPLETYRFFRDEKFEWVQFIPIVERKDFRENSPGVEPPPQRSPADFVEDWCVLPRQYGRFLIKVFDEWIRNDVGEVFVQIIEEAAAAWIGRGANLCIFRPECGRAMALEHNGDLYSCDHFVYPDFRLGNIHDTHVRELGTQQFQQDFGIDKSRKLTEACRSCQVRFICNGGCPKNRFYTSPSGEPGHNYLCAGYMDFFKHIDPYMRSLGQLLRSGRPAPEIMQMVRQSDEMEAQKQQSSGGKRGRKRKRKSSK